MGSESEKIFSIIAHSIKTIKVYSAKVFKPLACGVTLTGIKHSPLFIRLDFEYPPLTYRDRNFHNPEGDEPDGGKAVYYTVTLPE